MTEEEIQIINDAIERFGVVSASYLMRKLKCDYDRANELIKLLEQQIKGT